MRSWIFGNKSTSNNANDSGADDSAAAGSASSERTGRNVTFRSATAGSNHSSNAGSTLSTPPTNRGTRGVGGGGLFVSHATSSRALEVERKVGMAARSLGEGVQSIVQAAKQQKEWKSQLLELLGNQPHLDYLLEHSNSSKFVLRCMEHELPPNLIHCLRLLRVVELQKSTSQKEGQESSQEDSVDERKLASNVDESSQKHPARVAKLLSTLCVDPSVGEQLRPHLFGLLALTGASYPQSGVPVAMAASEVVHALAKHCLTKSLVWFLHDRKMIVHMTEDCKELCGMPTSSGQGHTVQENCLHGLAAEEAGLWHSALSTVLVLVVESCHTQCLELLWDFEKAEGYQVLQYALEKAQHHVAELIPLLPLLACCHTTKDELSPKLIKNSKVFPIMQSLWKKAIPLYDAPPTAEDEEGSGPALDVPRLALEIYSIAAPGVSRNDEDALAMHLLKSMLQLYADHSQNYDILEKANHHVLSYYLLSYPVFQEAALQEWILKTLEFVVIGIDGAASEPLRVLTEVYFAMCVQESKSRAHLEAISGTFEKLLQFDNHDVAPVLLQGGIASSKLQQLLEGIQSQQFSGLNAPARQEVDFMATTYCRILKWLVTKQQEASSSHQLHSLIETALFQLGHEPAKHAASVFEAYMSTHVSLSAFENDLDFLFGLLLHHKSVEMGRQGIILSVCKGVLDSHNLAREAFRKRGGFDTLLKLCVMQSQQEDVARQKDKVIEVLPVLLGLLEAATGGKKQSGLATGGDTSFFPMDSMAVDPVTAQMALSSPAVKNLLYLRSSGFYLDLATIVAHSGVLDGSPHAQDTIDLVLGHIDSSLPEERVTRSSSMSGSDGEEHSERGKKEKQSLRNPDAIRLALGLAIFSPDKSLAQSLIEVLMRLCAPEKLGKTLSQVGFCGLCWSLTNPHEFAGVLTLSPDDAKNAMLQSKFWLLLRRIASCHMSYSDIVAILRCVAGPVLLGMDDSNGSSSPNTNVCNRGTVRLPVISSSVRRRKKVLMPSTNHEGKSEETDKEAEFTQRLETLCSIAEGSDRVPRFRLGGDTINTIAVLMHQVKLDDRLHAAAETGRLKFLEVESVHASAVTMEGLATSGTQVSGSSSNSERIWTPLASTGFSYSLWMRHGIDESTPPGNIYLLDISSPTASGAGGSQGSAIATSPQQSTSFLAVWYDVQNQRFNVLTSASFRGEPTCFPVSPLKPNVWHHLLLTYAPPKRSVIARKATFGMYVDGRPLEADVKVESVNLPPNARVVIGAPNPSLAAGGIVRGALPSWELGPSLMVSTILTDMEVTSIFVHGPEFQGTFWGDRPQRLSLAATAASTFPLLSENGEKGSVAVALRRRDIGKMEAAGVFMRETLLFGRGNADGDSLASLGLLLDVSTETVVFAFRASTTINRMKFGPAQHQHSAGGSRHFRPHSERVVNLGRLAGNQELVSTDAVVCGKGSIIASLSFADNIQWVGGPTVLAPVVNAATSARCLALALRLIRASVHRHAPNLEMMQSGGGYRMLAVLLQEKNFIDERVLYECFAFAVHGFEPPPIVKDDGGSGSNGQGPLRTVSHRKSPEGYVFADLDAMKQLLLNHQLWDLRAAGPTIPLRLLLCLSSLVSHESTHKAFNSRRLHLLGIVRWTLHLMLEAAEFFQSGEVSARQGAARSDEDPSKATTASLSGKWYCEPPAVDVVAVGGDPDNPLLQACKTLLRRVLTFMLTPGDLEAIADATVYTVSVDGSCGRSEKDAVSGIRLSPHPVVRVYLLRLLEELIVDGVNEIMASPRERRALEAADSTADPTLQPHAGGGAGLRQAYISITMMRGKMEDGSVHPKYQQAQAFLSAFSGVLTPVWFASLLEGCQEEASAAAVLRLMVLMLQSSTAFVIAFEDAGGFAPLVLSIPKFSTCPSITTSMLAQLLQAPILHIPCFPMLDAVQLSEIFDAESKMSEQILTDNLRGGRRVQWDPSCGIFALLAECLGRNIQLAPLDNEIGQKARQTNKAVLELLANRHSSSPSFQEFCRTPDFLEPLAQALCLIHDEKLQHSQQEELSIGDKLTVHTNYQDLGEDHGVDRHMKRRGNLSDVPKGVSATDRFIGRAEDAGGSSGVGMVEMLRLVVTHAVNSGSLAAPLISALFRSFPIHASPEQVEAFHLVLVEHCKLVVGDALQRGEPVSTANCIGVTSVILDRLLAGFFTSEPVLEAVHAALTVMKSLSSSESKLLRNLGSADHSMLAADALHMARIMCITALRRSRSMGPFDEGDEDLQRAVVEQIATNIQFLLGGGQPSRHASSAPSPGSKNFHLWRSASLLRCSTELSSCRYRDLHETDDPERLFIVPLLVEIHVVLSHSADDFKNMAVEIIVELLQKRRNIMSELLITDVVRNGKKETIDVMNRGGFGALLVAHEAALAGKAKRSGASGSSPKTSYDAFFDWFTNHDSQVQIVFEAIRTQACKLFPQLDAGGVTPEEAIEDEQKAMLLRLTSQDASDRTILGGLERAEVAQLCTERTTESHVHWRRLGFDDLASGAMRWKVLLRQLKGSCSIWEGGTRCEDHSLSSRYERLCERIAAAASDTVDASKGERIAEKNEVELVTRWKLDLAEGHERQRRRLLPNYEFHSLYNVDEMTDQDSTSRVEAEDRGPEFFAADDGIDATAALLKDLKIKRASHTEDDDFFYDCVDTIDDEVRTETTATVMTDAESTATRDDEVTPQPQTKGLGMEGLITGREGADAPPDSESDSSYELITGLLQAGDWPEKSYNVRRCTGLEVRKALLLFCRDAIYIIDGFEQSEGEGLEGRITRVENEKSTFNINLRPKNFKATDEKTGDEAEGGHGDSGTGDKTSERNRTKQKATQELQDDAMYQHRSQRLSFSDVHSVFLRRYQLQPIALEFYDVNNIGTLVAFSTHDDREEVLSKVLNSDLPNSIFNNSYGQSINYKKFMSTWKSKIVSQWSSGKMPNFDFLMHLNFFAGRTYNDLTQYPVFPWVIADYDSEEIDLDDPSVYRDLAKPMGALGEERARQFTERYESLQAHYFNEDDPPPFHYGTHYSSAAYVLYYLMRLEPFSRLALSLQGGKFDVPDRLFHNVGSSWKSASSENLQDVRELIPEFYYLPEFLVNTNNFDFGTTQKGKTVHDVTLPKWAKGDPSRFVRINRRALESDYVSKHLNHWVDLVFGYKQRGEEAVKALNTFVHVTYEGEVDLNAMEDPIQRASTIAQIQNFGQTPSRLERRPFPQRNVYQLLREKTIDFGALSGLTPLTPALCVVGAPQRVCLRLTQTENCKLGLTGHSDKAVGDMCLVKGQLLGVGRMCALILPSKKYCRYGGPNNGVSVHVASATARHVKVNKLLSVHDNMHRAPISVAKVSRNGHWLVTGCVDSTVRVWKYDKETKVDLKATLCGHEGWQVTCLDICTDFGTIVTGCAFGNVLLWDLRTLTFVRQLRKPQEDSQHTQLSSTEQQPAKSVSINHSNGNILTLVGSTLSIFDINGNLLASHTRWRGGADNHPTCAVALDCPEWMEQGVVAVTGHAEGEVYLWSLDYDERALVMRHVLSDNPHNCEVTCLRVGGDVRQDALLVGDQMGNMSYWKSLPLESFTPSEISEVSSELKSGVKLVHVSLKGESSGMDNVTWIGGLTVGGDA